MTQTLGELLPEIRKPLPAPESARLVDALARTESPAITMRRARRAETSGAPHDPIVWARARGANVVDADGNIFVDLTSGFGAVALGHCHPRVVGAVRDQATDMLQALGDVHPSKPKIALLERLGSIAPWPDTRIILGLSGSDAIEAALKTAALATRRPGVIAFEGSYHGLGYGSLAVCGLREAFRAPFHAQLNQHVIFVPYPRDTASGIAALERTFDAAATPLGAVLIEPVLGRGGVRPAPTGLLAGVAQLCQRHGALVISDEILTGLGRCGVRWRSLVDAPPPDILCVGKALGGGLPISACIARADVMAAWGAPSEESLHTSTFVGNPLACAAAMASLAAIEEERAPELARVRGERLVNALRALQHEVIVDVRGEGLLVGVELASGRHTLAAMRKLLERGWITLAAGSNAEVLEILAPLNIAETLLDAFVCALDQVLTEVAP